MLGQGRDKRPDGFRNVAKLTKAVGASGVPSREAAQWGRSKKPPGPSGVALTDERMPRGRENGTRQISQSPHGGRTTSGVALPASRPSQWWHQAEFATVVSDQWLAVVSGNTRERASPVRWRRRADMNAPFNAVIDAGKGYSCCCHEDLSLAEMTNISVNARRTRLKTVRFCDIVVARPHERARLLGGHSTRGGYSLSKKPSPDWAACVPQTIGAMWLVGVK